MNARPTVILPFESVVEDVSGGNEKVQKGDYRPTGLYPIVDQGQEFVGGFCNDEGNLVQSEGPWIVFGDHTRALKFVDFPFCMGADGVKVLRPRLEQSVDPKYLYHFLNANPVPSAGYSRHYKFLKRLNIPLPPIDEQRRIAAILDKADTLRRKRKRALELLDTLTQSIFLDMFGDLIESDEYPRGVIADWVADFDTGKNLASDPDDDRDGGYRVLKVSAVTTGIFLPSESKRLPSGYEPPESHIVRDGDLLFSRANTAELVGATAYVEAADGSLVLPDKIWRFQWSEANPPDPHFIQALFSSPSFRREISKRATGTSGSMKNISKEKVLAIEVAAPSRELQEKFAMRKALIQRARCVTTKHLTLFEAQFASLQHRAFSGQL